MKPPKNYTARLYAAAHPQIPNFGKMTRITKMDRAQRDIQAIVEELYEEARAEGIAEGWTEASQNADRRL